MRIAFTFEGSLPSPQADAEVFTHTAAAVAGRGHEVSLLFARGAKRAPSPETILDYYGIKRRFPLIPVPVPFEQMTLQHASQAILAPMTEAFRRSDVVYTRNPAILATALSAGAKVFFDHYRPLPDQSPWMQPLLRAWMTHPRFLGMACHSRLARESFARIGVPSDRLRVIYNGFDPARMTPALSTEEARASLGWSSSRPTVMYTGRVNARKGLEVVLDMARALPECDFVLVGTTGDDNPIERAAQRVENVRLVPWQTPEATARHLYAADVLIIPPSRAPLEAHGRTVLPLKLFLYMASGRPVLAGDTPDVAELLQHERNALLVAPDDSEEAASAVRRLLGDRELAQRIAATAKADSETLTWDKRAERVESFLVERLAAPRERDVGAGWSVGGWLRQCVRR